MHAVQRHSSLHNKLATQEILLFYKGRPTRYRTRHFFNNSNTNEDIAIKFEQEYELFFHISYTMS